MIAKDPMELAERANEVAHEQTSRMSLLLFDLADTIKDLVRQREERTGPDDPADCPAGHGQSCCGYHEECQEALRRYPNV